MRLIAKLLVLVVLVVSGQIAFDVIAATSSYPGFSTSQGSATIEADAAVEVESRLANCNPASRWIANQVLGIGRAGA